MRKEIMERYTTLASVRDRAMSHASTMRPSSSSVNWVLRCMHVEYATFTQCEKQTAHSEASRMSSKGEKKKKIESKQNKKAIQNAMLCK